MVVSTLIPVGVTCYLLLTVAVGLWAARKVRTTEDFLLAGHGLSMPLATATVFATWFGAETVLGTSAEVARHGLRGAIVDPLGAALCLILIGLFFARRIYRLNLTTFADFYRLRFGKATELLASVALIVSYLGWLAGQFVALGLIGELVFGLDRPTGIWIGCGIVTLYTVTGGMWSIAWLDLLQNGVIVAGLVGALIQLSAVAPPLADWLGRLPENFLILGPDECSPVSFLNWFALWITVGLGSIPQQDVFQRVMASKSAGVARRSALVGGFLYLTVGFLPIVLAVYLRAYHPELIGLQANGLPLPGSEVDPQTTIPMFIVNRVTPLVAMLFIGALLSAIMSTGAAALLAPAAIFAENLIPVVLPGRQGLRDTLWLNRICVVLVAAVALAMALARGNIHALVAESSALSLVSLFVSLCVGLFIPEYASGKAALASIIGGGLAWWVAGQCQTQLEPLLIGLATSAVAYLVCRWLLPQSYPPPSA
jgi:Na+/proline symporter